MLLFRLDGKVAANYDGNPAFREAVFDPDCFSVHPLKMVHGLAGVAEKLGAQIFERSTVIDVQPAASPAAAAATVAPAPLAAVAAGATAVGADEVNLATTRAAGTAGGRDGNGVATSAASSSVSAAVAAAAASGSKRWRVSLRTPAGEESSVTVREHLARYRSHLIV